MKLISEEINNAEYIVEEKENEYKKITKSRISFYKVILKIEMARVYPKDNVKQRSKKI